MAEENFETNVLRTIAAELYFLVGMTAAREMYGKSYFALGVIEKAAVDQAVLGGVASNYQAITPELLKAQTTKTTPGFQAPAPVK
jgi:hypothetical protein